MIRNLIFFNDSKDLERITDLSHDELWKAGFNLDDMDFGFMSEVKLHKKVDSDGNEVEEQEFNKYDDNYIDYDWCEPTYYLMLWSENHSLGCNYGYNYTEYNGKHFYTVHHS